MFRVITVRNFAEIESNKFSSEEEVLGFLEKNECDHNDSAIAIAEADAGRVATVDVDKDGERTTFEVMRTAASS